MEDLIFDNEGNIAAVPEKTEKPKKRLSPGWVVVIFCVVYLGVWMVYAIFNMECWEGTYRIEKAEAIYTVTLTELENGDYHLSLLTENAATDGSIETVIPSKYTGGRDMVLYLNKDGQTEYVHLFMERENLLQLTYVYPYTEDSKPKRIKAIKLKQID